ncbi:MAG: DUF692 domain-containing protein [Sphingomonas sp.]|jgi:hypothetical protein|uniref:MNIO family bufferin maturase n=1 Tax=Sphingomonas sp. TaxID=28214 RepID=UPI00356627AA
MPRSQPSQGHAATTAAPCHGIGVGLRYPHHQQFLDGSPRVDWLEVHAENYLGGIALDDLLTIRRDYPVSVHAIGLSLGSSHGIDQQHLGRIADLCDRVEPGLVSDHVSWSSLPSRHLPDLLPLPYTDEALAICCANIDRVQNRLKRRLLVENPSRYLAFLAADFSEGGFLAELAARTGCGVLLDLNNILVSASNLGRSAAGELAAVLEAVPAAAIGEIHIAGHSIVPLPDGGHVCVDDHGSTASQEVWQMLETVTRWLGPRPVLIEWDTNLPPFDTLRSEAERARTIVDHVQDGRHALN